MNYLWLYISGSSLVSIGLYGWTDRQLRKSRVAVQPRIHDILFILTQSLESYALFKILGKVL